MTSTLTRDIGEFLARVVACGVPRAAHDAAKEGFIDCIGTMVAGSREVPTRTIQRALAPLADGPAQLWFSRATTRPDAAALLNGVAAHALDFDDVALRGHPSAVIVPAVIAVAQELDADGSRMLDAYVAGYEVWAELVDREQDIHHMKGWHPTGIFGSIAASAACAVLRRLDAVQCAHAVALGASQSAGLMSNFGAMAKPFHAGRAAQSGVLSSQLAAHGFTGAFDALEHPQGFLMAVSPSGRVDTAASAERLGRSWQLPLRRLNIKKYPICYYAHRVVDGLLDLVEERQIAPHDVTRIDVSISREQATVLRNHAPDTGLAAKFSIEFAVAAALIARKVGLLELDDDFVRRPVLQRLMRLVHVQQSDRYDPDAPGWAWTDHVHVTLSDGSTHHSAEIHHARGHAELPLTERERSSKFLDCLAYGHFNGDAAHLLHGLQTLESHRARKLAPY